MIHGGIVARNLHANLSGLGVIFSNGWFWINQYGSMVNPAPIKSTPLQI